MSPLEEIVGGASNDEVAKGKVVAHRLDADDIRVWTDRELVDYGSEDLLPEYRSREATVASGRLPDEAKSGSGRPT